MQSNLKYPVPIPSSYWVLPGRFLAGEYPGSKDEAEARQKVQHFLEHGVGFFLDLTCEGDLAPYAHHLPGGSSAKAAYHRFPIQDFGTPTAQEMIAMLDAIDAALEQKRVIYVHCWGGIGRTGTVVGCYLVRHGMTGQTALEEIGRLRRSLPFTDRLRQSPETNGQRQMVLNWKQGQ